ncbi:MAG: metallophosphoesterase [bacterium]
MTRRTKQTILFFLVFYVIFGSVNFYISLRGFEALEYVSGSRLVYGILFFIISNSYLVGRVVERRYMSFFSDTFIWIGSFWFAFVLYFFLSVVALDLVRLFDLFGHFLPQGEAYLKLKLCTMIADVVVVGFICLIGYFNAKKIRVKRLDLEINKPNSVAKELTLAVASDLHLGTIVGKWRAKQIVDRLNSIIPDLILLPGDIVDGDVDPVIKLNLGEVLRQLKSRFGVFAITGNHEYIGGVEPSVNYITEHGIRVLRDEKVEVAGMTIMGREDRSISGFAGKERKSLEILVEGVNKKLPLILLDHQPFKLDEAVSEGVDLQLSGHTHNGQLWPLNFITKKVYELSWGYKLKGTTHVYVSCGVGTWGPPMKLGNVSEILEIHLKFTG